MRKFLLLTSFLFTAFAAANAQYPVVSIYDLQQPVTTSCNDTSTYNGDTVVVHAKVVMDGGLAQASSGRNIWLQSGSGGAWSGLDVYGFGATATSPTDILDLVAGDSVVITGWMDEYIGETELRPISVDILGSGMAVNSTVVNLSDLNDNAQNNQIGTGEQWEGAYIELQNVTVTAVTYFSGNTRVSFIVEDGSGNAINVSDRFLVQRLPASGGTFVPPTVGDQYCSLKGVLMHSKNNCAGFTGRGYELHPFDTAHYQICSAAPAIFNVQRNIVTPSSSQTVTVTAEITDADGIASATLYYATGQECATSFTSVSMNNTSGNTWSADIPAQSDGTWVEYYVCATDNSANTGCNTNVPNGSNPYFYTVRDNGTTIYDVQYVPQCYGTGNSGYIDMTVTVEGVVTASAEPGNLGYVFIGQEGGLLGWSGIMLTDNASLATLNVGDKVTVTGVVKEDFGYTRIEQVSNVALTGSGSIAAVTVSPDVFSTYDFATNEQYEGMLLNLKNPSGVMYVVDENPDSPSNFAEWRIGTDQFDPNNGSRVLSGRQTSSAFSSLNVSWVNDSSWVTNDGLMNVDPCIVMAGMEFDSLKGIMYYSFGNFKILPRNNDDVGRQLCNVAIDDPELGSVKVFPNPSAGIFRIDYELEGLSGAGVEVYDLMGRKMAETRLDGVSGNVALDLSNLPSGAYLLNVSNEEGMRLSSQRIVISR